MPGKYSIRISVNPPICNDVFEQYDTYEFILREPDVLSVPLTVQDSGADFPNQTLYIAVGISVAALVVLIAAMLWLLKNWLQKRPLMPSPKPDDSLYVSELIEKVRNRRNGLRIALVHPIDPSDMVTQRVLFSLSDFFTSCFHAQVSCIDSVEEVEDRCRLSNAEWAVEYIERSDRIIVVVTPNTLCLMENKNPANMNECVFISLINVMKNIEDVLYNSKKVFVLRLNVNSSDVPRQIGITPNCSFNIATDLPYLFRAMNFDLIEGRQTPNLETLSNVWKRESKHYRILQSNLEKLQRLQVNPSNDLCSDDAEVFTDDIDGETSQRSDQNFNREVSLSLASSTSAHTETSFVSSGGINDTECPC